MSDLFTDKNVRPMLIGAEGEAFDSPDYLYELKLDGERCIAYLAPTSGTELRNKRNLKLLPKVPELSGIHRQATCRCILDGELAVIRDGKPDFYEIQRRSLMSTPLKIELAAKKYPACFTAFDILYYEDHPVTDLPLSERKALLQKAVIEESARFAVSRVVENNGVAFFRLAKARELEGIVAKRKDSRYYFDKRTKDWIKCKNLKDADYVVCGYLPKENGRISLVLGQYAGETLTYKGHVTLGVCGGSFRRIRELPRLDTSPFAAPAGNERAVWVAPVLCCTVKYMEKTESGHLRQPVFKGLREDKLPEECVEHESRVTEKRRG